MTIRETTSEPSSDNSASYFSASQLSFQAADTGNNFLSSLEQGDRPNTVTSGQDLLRQEALTLLGQPRISATSDRNIQLAHLPGEPKPKSTASDILPDLTLTVGRPPEKPGDLTLAQARPSDKQARPERLSGEAKERQDFERANRVNIERVGNEYVYRLPLTGQSQELFRTEASAAGLRDAREQLRQRVEAQQKEMTERWGVTFSRPGETLRFDIQERSRNPNERDTVRTIERPAREPSLAEVMAIRSALEKTGAAIAATDSSGVSRPLHFNFMPQEFRSPNTFEMSDGRPTINVGEPAQPPKFKHFLISDALRNDPNLSPQRLSEVAESLEFNILHEIAHRSHTRLGLDDPARGQSHIPEPYSEQMGWTLVNSKTTGQNLWMFRGRQEGQYFVNGGSIRADDRTWFRADSNGQPVNSSGRQVSNWGQAQKLTLEQMRNVAAVPPHTDYFLNRKEMIAESLAIYRAGGQLKEHAIVQSPQLYEVAKKMDQDEINLVHGRNSQGLPNMIRNWQGQIVPNTETNRRQVEEQENLIRQRARTRR